MPPFMEVCSSSKLIEPFICFRSVSQEFLLKLELLKSLGWFYDRVVFSPTGASTLVPPPPHYYSGGATFPLTMRSTHLVDIDLHYKSMLPVVILHFFLFHFCQRYILFENMGVVLPQNGKTYFKNFHLKLNYFHIIRLIITRPYWNFCINPFISARDITYIST